MFHRQWREQALGSLDQPFDIVVVGGGARLTALLPRRPHVVVPEPPEPVNPVFHEPRLFVNRLLHWVGENLGTRTAILAVAAPGGDHLAVLAATVLAEFAIKIKGYFGIDDWFGFGAVYGFLSCLAMVLVAKALGAVLKRPRDYYPEGRDDA